MIIKYFPNNSQKKAVQKNEMKIQRKFRVKIILYQIKYFFVFRFLLVPND